MAGMLGEPHGPAYPMKPGLALLTRADSRPGAACGHPISRTKESSMNFAYTILYVPDVAASLAFFERAFGLKTRFLHESGAYGEVDPGAGGTTLPFVDHATARDGVQHDYVAASSSTQPL